MKPVLCRSCGCTQFGYLVCTVCGIGDPSGEASSTKVPVGHGSFQKGSGTFIPDPVDPDTARSPELELLAKQQANEIAEELARTVVKKYVNGYLEHGGNLDTKFNLDWFLEEIEKEAIDLYVYTTMARRRLKRIMKEAGL